MSRLVMRVLPGGRIRAVHADGYAFTAHDCGPARRASTVEPIESGPNAGCWAVDFSPMARVTGNPFFMQYCLWPPFPATQRQAALDAERQHLIQEWVNGPREIECGFDGLSV